jgi:hypothetical protein
MKNLVIQKDSVGTQIFPSSHNCEKDDGETAQQATCMCFNASDSKMYVATTGEVRCVSLESLKVGLLATAALVQGHLVVLFPFCANPLPFD